MDMEFTSTDVLVIGAGAAGIRAAIAACESAAHVVMLAAEDVAYGGSTFSEISKGWGIQALVGAERTTENLEDFYEDIIRVGLGQCDPKLVRILVEESGARVEDLISYGLKFKIDSEGNYIRAKGCFSGTTRAFLTSDFSNMQRTFSSILRRLPVRVVLGTAADLILDDGICAGAWVIDKNGTFLHISAKSTILASGGGNGVYADHIGNGCETGDGYAMAFLAGAKLTNMEFIQFALGLKNNGTRQFLPIGQLSQSERIITAAGCDILKKSIPDAGSRDRALNERQTHMPFSCRDSAAMVDIAVARAMQNNVLLYWHSEGPDERRSEVAHLAHAFNGGVKITAKGESTIPGLFAAGEVAAGAYGADRIGGCMMTATQVFGKRAGQSAVRHAKSINQSFSPTITQVGTDRTGKSKIGNDVLHALAAIENRVKESMGKYAGVLRSEIGLKNCKKILESCLNQLGAMECFGFCKNRRYFKVRNMVITANLVVESALARKKSLGSHYREDDKSWEAGRLGS